MVQFAQYPRFLGPHVGTGELEELAGLLRAGIRLVDKIFNELPGFILQLLQALPEYPLAVFIHHVFDLLRGNGQVVLTGVDRGVEPVLLLGIADIFMTAGADQVTEDIFIILDVILKDLFIHIGESLLYTLLCIGRGGVHGDPQIIFQARDQLGDQLIGHSFPVLLQGGNQF